MKMIRTYPVLFFIFALTFSGLWFTRDYVAQVAWKRFHSPEISLAFVRKDATLAMNIGNYYFGGGEYDLEIAESAYSRALLITPGILWGHYQKARIYFVRNESDEALQEIEQELKFNPENLRSLYIRGLIYAYRGKLGDLELSENDFREFTRWAPTEWAGYNDLAWVLIKQGKNKQAIEVTNEAFEKAIGAKENSWIWNMQGVAELDLEQYSMAKISFEKAMVLAEKLSESEWQKAYPGNSPQQRNQGLTEFRYSIAKNIEKASEGITSD